MCRGSVVAHISRVTWYSKSPHKHTMILDVDYVFSEISIQCERGSAVSYIRTDTLWVQ